MAKNIGILACSPEGAALCYQTICRLASEVMGQHSYPEISMHNHPLGDYMDFIYKDKWNGVKDLMLSSAEKLQKAGADFLICPDNTVHQVFDEVESKSPLPLLHIAREVAMEAKTLGYKKSGILGTEYLLTGPVYPDAYEKTGLECIIPSLAVRERINKIIFSELVYGKINKESKKYLQTQIRILKGQDCDSVVLGCTEIPLIVKPRDSRLPVLDSTRILAKAALRLALES